MESKNDTGEYGNIPGRIIRHVCGLKTLRFAKKFLRKAGIEIPLHKGMGAFLNDTSNWIRFAYGHPPLYSEILDFIVDNSLAKVTYTIIAQLHYIMPSKQQRDIGAVISGIVRDSENGLVNVTQIKSNGTVCLSSETPTNSYEPFADLVSRVHHAMQLERTLAYGSYNPLLLSKGHYELALPPESFCP